MRSSWQSIRRTTALSLPICGHPESSLVQQATVQSLELAQDAALGYVQWPSQDRALHDQHIRKWAMRVCGVDFHRSGELTPLSPCAVGNHSSISIADSAFGYPPAYVREFVQVRPTGPAALRTYVYIGFVH